MAHLREHYVNRVEEVAVEPKAEGAHLSVEREARQVHRTGTCEHIDCFVSNKIC